MEGQLRLVKALLVVSVIHALTLAPVTDACGGNAQADIIFVMDESGSVSYNSFQSMKTFVKQLVDGLTIGSNSIRVGLMKYASGTTREFDLSSYYDKNAMMNHILNLGYSPSGTNTGAAIQFARTQMFTSSKGDRSGVSNILVVITDGRSYGSPTVAQAGRDMRNTGATVFAVGIGAGIPLGELNEMATDPDSDHVFAVSGFSALGAITSKFTQSVCPPTHGNWGGWGGYGSCSVNCGGGSKSRSRSCNNPAPSNGGNNCAGSSSSSTSCNTHSCAVNGNWGNWGGWGSCSKSCASGSKSRSRSCNNPPASGGGAPCAGSGSQSTSCNTHHCPVHGNWGGWGSYGSCTKSCASGTKTRSRSCNNPSPQHGGNQCAGSSSSSASCNTHPCPVHGNWGGWGGWATCSVTCGGGSKGRTRSCNNPSPAHGGNQCPGASHSSTSCNTHHCPIDGGFGGWSGWGSCSKTCGTGSKSRSRQCNNPAPLYGGANCAGAFSDSTNCNTHPCPIDGGFTSWTSWGTCSTTCELGSWSRSRSCTSPSPQHGGAACSGATGQTTSCNLRPCPVDGYWSTWQQWSQCSITCMAIGVRGRIRACDNPTPAHGGAACAGAGSESQTCDKRLHLCSPGTGFAPTVLSTTAGTPVNGGFGSWGQWTTCSKSCASGTRLRTRPCNNPVPRYGGNVCSGSYVETQLCNNVPCPAPGSQYVQTCPARYFDCQNGNVTCIHFLKKCDCIMDCEDGSDEDPDYAGCTSSTAVCNNPASLVRAERAVIALFAVIAVCVSLVFRLNP